MFWTGLQKNFAPVKTEQNISSVEVFRFVDGSREENVTKDIHCILYSVVSLVVPRLEEAPVLKKISKVPSILEQKGHRYPPRHSKVGYDHFGGWLETICHIHHCHHNPHHRHQDRRFLHQKENESLLTTCTDCCREGAGSTKFAR